MFIVTQLSFDTVADSIMSQKFRQFGRKLAYYRRKVGFTQETFAEAVGKSHNYIAQLEGPSTHCGARLETVFKMAEVLNIPISKLFEEDDEA